MADEGAAAAAAASTLSALPLLGDAAKLRAASNSELMAQISNCLAAGRVPQYPPIHLAALHALIERICAPVLALQQQQQDPTAFFYSQQVRMIVAHFLSTAAKSEGYAIQGWFLLPSSLSSSSSSPSPLSSSSGQDETSDHHAAASMIASIVAMLLGSLAEEAHSMAVGEAFRLLLQSSPQVLQAFVAYRVPFPAPPTMPAAGSGGGIGGVAMLSSSSQHQQQQQLHQQQLQLHQQSFGATAFGVIAPFLTDTCALRNYAAWQMFMAALQPDPGTTLQPPREVVELLSKHVHAYIEMLVVCLRHANPVCRRFTLRVLTDTLQSIRAWNPIANCILQSPAIFFAILANADGPPVPEHWPCYQIVKMFVSLPSKCPLMRHLIYINRDALAEYVQMCSMRFGLNVEGETKFLLSKLDGITPLTAEEAALIHCSI